MTTALDVVELSRLQFGLTAMYHFLFVPLTLGLSILLGIMESVYVLTGKEIWRQATKFWGTLFGINFAMGVATGITMEFQFGMNWAYFSHYVGDIFGAPLALEGLMAFFLEATFVGLFFFGWDRLSKVAHLCVTWLVAAGSNLSALWILIANGWMQHPVGARFNPDTMRMEETDFGSIIFNEVAQEKFVHTVSAGYVTGAVFVASVSAIYLLLGKHIEMARRSMTVAVSFGLASALSVVVLGDASGYTDTENQKMKIAAIEAMWETEPPPASFIFSGCPTRPSGGPIMRCGYPWCLASLRRIPSTRRCLASRNWFTATGRIFVLGSSPMWRSKSCAPIAATRMRARSSIETLIISAMRSSSRKSVPTSNMRLMPKSQRPPGTAEIAKAAWDTVPQVALLFWAFRVMVGLGFFFILLFGFAFYLVSTSRLLSARALLWVLAFALPLPWIAAELGWVVSEVGRQPWAIEGVLPTFLAVSSVSASNVLVTLFGFIGFYSVLLIVDIYLMVKAIRLGPGETLSEPHARAASAAGSAE